MRPQLPVAPCDPYHEKPFTVIPWTQGRPFVWLDDEDAVVTMAGEAPGGNAVKVDPATGLTSENLQAAAVLLEQIGALAAA